MIPPGAPTHPEVGNDEGGSGNGLCAKSVKLQRPDLEDSCLLGGGGGTSCFRLPGRLWLGWAAAEDADRKGA